MTTNLHDKMLAAIDALFSASDAVEEEAAENLLLDVRDEILKHKRAEQAQPVATAWAEGYRQGVADERTSEANIGIAGFGAKVEPARQNPYGTAPPPRQPLTKQEIVDAVQAAGMNFTGPDITVARAIEAAHGIKGEA